MHSNIVEDNPSDLEAISRRIDQLFELQRSNRFNVRVTTAAQRIAKLKRISHWILENRERFHEALYADFKKPAAEVDLTEIFVVTSEIKYAVRHLKKWMKHRKVRRTLATITTKSWIEYEPKGVVLILSPWNFPVNLTVGPLISAIAAGNCAIIKPSEYTPNTSALMREMLESLFPENEVAVFEGGPKVATMLLKKRFDHIFFTGSPAVGKIVMKAAAENLTTVTLELGGKSPVIVDDTANIKDAARKIAWGKFMNKGQTCVAPDYMFIQESKYSEFLDELKFQIKRAYGETEAEREESHSYPRIISDRHHQRLAQMLKESLQDGAKIEMGGAVRAEDKYISPTVLSRVSLDSSVMQEEIFGPILPVIPYKNMDEVIEIINSKEKPLALYIFSKSDENIERILSKTASGGVCINDVVLHYLHLNLPFGGIGNSGHGNSHGYYGFKAFSHERAILKHGPFSPLKLMYPPYTKTVQKFVDLTLKYL